MLEGKIESLLSNFIGASNLIILYHPLIELDKEDRQRAISDILPQSTSWIFISLGQSDYDFKKALLKIVKIVDKPESLPVLKQFTLAPTQIWNTNDEVFIILRKESSVEKVEVQITDFALERKIENIRQTNPSTFAFSPSGLAPGRKKVEVFLNGKTVGRSYLNIKSKIEMLNRLLHEVVNPIELLCQTLNIETRSRECVDLELNDIFTNGGSNPLSEYANENFDFTSDIHKQSELPTLLHFAAKYGLEQLCTTLLTFPGGKHALKIKNNNGKTPYKLAIAGEFTHLADNILLEYDVKEEKDDTSEDAEDHYVAMEAIRGDKKDKPVLPRRSSQLSDVSLDYPYANVSIREKRRINSDRRSKVSQDSGEWTDDCSGSITDTLEKTGDDLTPTLRSRTSSGEKFLQMSYRMTRLWNDEAVKLPESTKL
ncbi:uncharacterized protein LOC134726967 [Mytilus trossulus]|uniref:uncharacterized protein LOC134726967 n=1 Tax=Mytilus trossulus TaxID=6551 RepID=UPI0030040E52